MKLLRLSIMLFSLILLDVAPVKAQANTLPMLPSSSARNYRNLPIGELNLAYRQVLAGKFEEALMTYNSALAWQADWIPALAGRATLYQRLGRTRDAQLDRMAAERQDPYATAFFMAKGQGALLPFLALYPQEWYQKNYGFDPVDENAVPPNTPQAFFTYQSSSIRNTDVTEPAVTALQHKVLQDVPASRQALLDLPRDYNAAVVDMLSGNLAMLEHNYAEAVAHYNNALLTNTVNWPELYYNRGLGNVLLHNYMNGCADLSESAKAGFAPGQVMFNSLCNF
jgi:tetratricopeptide (TPR) repeat protein